MHKYLGQATSRSLFETTLQSLTETVGKKDPVTLTCMHNLANLLIDENKLDIAESLIEESLRGRIEVLGASHRHTLSSMYILARLREKQGRIAESEALLLRAIKVGREQGFDNYVWVWASALAVNLGARGLLADAVALYRRLGVDDQSIEDPNIFANKGRAFHQLGEFHEAKVLYEKALQEDPLNHIILNNLAVIERDLGNLEIAETRLLALLDQNLQEFGQKNENTIRTRMHIATLRRDQGQMEESEKLYRQVLTAGLELWGQDHVSVLKATHLLGQLLVDQGKLEQAQPFVDKAFRARYDSTEACLIANALASHFGKVLFEVQSNNFAEASSLCESKQGDLIRVYGSGHTRVRMASEACQILRSAVCESKSDNENLELLLRELRRSF